MQNAPTGNAAQLVNVAAEQQVLGALLLNNEMMARMGGYARADIFGDVAHRAVFSEVATRIKAGEFVSPVSLRLWADQNDAVRDAGGARYLANICGIASTYDFEPMLALLDDLRAKRDLSSALERAHEQIADAKVSAGEVAGGLEAALSSGVAETVKGPVSITSAVMTAVERISDAQKGIEPPGVVTGLQSVDRLVTRFSPGQLIILGGRPSMGKSALAIDIACNVARAGEPVCFASLEMPEDEIAMRVMAASMSEARQAVEYASLDAGGLNENQLRAAQGAASEIGDLPIDFLDQSYREIGALFAGAKQVQSRRGGLGLVVVDYLQLLRSPGSSRYEQITEISIGLKVLARQLGVPVLALAQLSRSVEGREDKRPMMSDLRDSGQIEQDADKVLFCYRDAYYLERQEPETDDHEAWQAWSAAMQKARFRLEVIVAKQRQGSIGTAHLNYAPALNRFWEA